LTSCKKRKVQYPGEGGKHDARNPGLGGKKKKGLCQEGGGNGLELFYESNKARKKKKMLVWGTVVRSFPSRQGKVVGTASGKKKKKKTGPLRGGIGKEKGKA